MMRERTVSRIAALAVIAMGTTLSAPIAFANPSDSTSLTDTQVAAAVLKSSPAPSGTMHHYTTAGVKVSVDGVTMVLASAKKVGSTVGGIRTFDGANSDFAVRATEDGVQALSIVSDSYAPRRASYEFPGKTLTWGSDGVVIVRTGSATGQPVAVIDAAWAKDSKGAAVNTRYTITGDTLVQVIEPTAATSYPVVADPRVRTAYYGWSVDFTKTETIYMAGGATACWAVSAAIPEPAVSKAVAVSCGLVSAWVGTAAALGKCVSVKVLWTTTVVPWIATCYK